MNAILNEGTAPVVSISEILCRVRASVNQIKRRARDDADANGIHSQVRRLFEEAMLVKSPVAVAVAVGSALELSLHPSEELLDQCMSLLPKGHCALRGLLWVARHRGQRQRYGKGPAGIDSFDIR